MTETTGDRDRGRLDLRALDIDPNVPRDEAAVQAVLASLTARPGQQDWWEWIPRVQRALAAAAVAFVLLAGVVLLSRRETDTRGDLAALIESWVASDQVPTNGELLTAYKGYRQ